MDGWLAAWLAGWLAAGWLVARGSVFEAFGFTLGLLFQVFGYLLVDLGTIVCTFGAHLVPLIYSRGLRGHF